MSTLKTQILIAFVLLAQTLWAQTGLDTSSFHQAMKRTHEGLIIIGEAHEVKSTYPTELLIIKELLKQNYQHILLEAGPSEVAILNRYLMSGDELLLDYTRARSEHYRAFIQGLKNLYDEKPFTLKGIDFDRSSCASFVLQNLLSYPFENPVDSIKSDLLSITQETKPKEYKSIIESVKQKYPTYQPYVDSLLLDQASIIHEMVLNPVYMADYGISSQKRDAQIYESIAAIDSATLAKSILIIGSNHITNKQHWWSLVESDSTLASVAQLYLFSYKNCQNFIKRKNYTSSKPLADYIKPHESEEAIVYFESRKNPLEEVPSKPNQITIISLINQ